ncbi:hypothetical protein AVEN_141409-1 [Araneus ventricosus]|uniref:Uncharacterized protein n=1 Tax=Araneus ventricosus TaxID=182803 RepID=A0A4Y2D1R5_ARAVE|nr:hypothetical protein AVEN_141409-1 [Araneus ventricosus]
MLNKVVPSILCIFSLLVIIRGQIPEPDNLDQYFKCWTFAECISEGSALDGIEHCINMLSQQVKSSIVLLNLLTEFIKLNIYLLFLLLVYTRCFITRGPYLKRLQNTTIQTPITTQGMLGTREALQPLSSCFSHVIV